LSEKPIILLIDDSEDSAQDYKYDAEEIIPVEVKAIQPPVNVLDLVSLVNEYNPSAVVLDEVLQQRSDATYLGIDAYNLLKKSFHTLPIVIITEYPPGRDLRELPTGNLIRKKDLGDQSHKENHLRDLYVQIEAYQQGKLGIANKVESIRGTTNYSNPVVSEELIKRIVILHFELEDGIEKIIWFNSESKNEIRLIEVSRIALPTGSFQPFRFPPTDEIPFPLMIADVTPKEWEQIQRGEIQIPQDWNKENTVVYE